MGTENGRVRVFCTEGAHSGNVHYDKFFCYEWTQ